MAVPLEFPNERAQFGFIVGGVCQRSCRVASRALELALDRRR
ncbi:hypothetical protein HDG35_007165 [Paraburkholderia sp. JPY681]|nr:hypothetical protein [Paraburkholderia atlantica]